MAIIASATTISPGTSYAAGMLYATKEFLKTSGWTVAGSGNGTTGGMDATDRWASVANASAQYSWIVLTSPHSNISDRVQIMLNKSASANASYFSYVYAPGNDFIGGGVSAYPTSATGVATFSNTTSLSAPWRMHALSDNSTPYGFVVAFHSTLGDPNGGTSYNYSFMLIPMTATPVGFGKPYYFASFLPYTGFIPYTGWSSNSGYTQVVAGTAPNLCRLCYYSQFNIVSGNTGMVIPGRVLTDADNPDLSFPVVFANDGPGQYLGVTNFMRYNGVNRGTLSTYSSRTRIVMGSYNFPWDGTTRPIP